MSIHTPTSRTATLVAAALSATLSACVLEDDLDVGTNVDAPSFEEFLADTYQEPWEGGVFIVNGDTPIATLEELREFYDELYSSGELIIHQHQGADSRWTNAQKHNLTYCVSTTFGKRYDTVVSAMNTAAARWEKYVDVDFVHSSSQDGSCNQNNTGVVFDVRPVNVDAYLARAFFPHEIRADRNVLIDGDAYSSEYPLADILTHELGHTLGFRHEHTRPEAGTCFEDNDWRALTAYDPRSVMQYPWCNGMGSGLTMSMNDYLGGQMIYGFPADARPTVPSFRVEYMGCDRYSRPRFSLSWWNQTLITVSSWDVDYRANLGSWKSLYTSSSSTPRMFTGNANTSYQFRVRGCNGNGCGYFTSRAVSSKCSQLPF